MEHVTILSLGEAIVEIVRLKLNTPHDKVGEYIGPFPSGAPTIFIDAAAKFGASSRFIGYVGNDKFGNLILKQLERDSVSTSFLKRLPGYTTGTAFVSYFSNGSREFVFHFRHSAAGQLGPKDISEKVIEDSDLLHIMGVTIQINERCRAACYKAVRLAKKLDVMISFDPNIRRELLDVSASLKAIRPILRQAQLVLPSASEATAITGKVDSTDAAKILLRNGAQVAAIKMGEKGSLVADPNMIAKVPAFRVKEVDPTGAGDVYDAAFLVSLLSGKTLRDSALFANAAGALKVTRMGPTSGPSRKEVERFLSRKSSNAD
jgi:sugar/nucleoside kinase (ribokinase family)